MEDFLVPLVLVATTMSAFLVGRLFSRSSETSLATAIVLMFECVGAGVVFFGLNVALAMALVLVVRTVGSQFVSLYAIDDVTLVILSFLQGLVFRFWWRSTRA
jgi:hypothetical protein